MTDVAEYFCQTHNVNIARQSCGDVRVQSYSYYKGEDRGNRFLVSYEGKSTNQLCFHEWCCKILYLLPSG